MSADVDIYQGPTQPSVYNVDPTGGRLVAWAEGLAAAHRIGSALCQTAFAPAHFKGKPDEAAAAIMFGDEVGFSPTQALRSIYVISGTPSLYARQMAALVIHHGHEVWTVEKSDAKVTVSGRRRGSEHTMTETWTTARAQKAGYTSNKKYLSDPQAMLYARALADVCRQIAPDALAGLAYTVEEMEIQEPAPTVRAVRAKAAPAPMPEPDLNPVGHGHTEPPQTDGAAGESEAPPMPPSPAAQSQADPDVAMSTPGSAINQITRAQSKMLHALLNKHGMKQREQYLPFLSHEVGRDLGSSDELTKAEASSLINAETGSQSVPEPDFGDES